MLTSVDAAHRINIINLIFSEFKEHQLIITTHDIVLYKEILELEKLYGGNNKFRNIEICEWTKDRGPILDDTKSEIEKLREHLTNPHTDKNILLLLLVLFLELVLCKKLPLWNYQSLQNIKINIPLWIFGITYTLN